MKLYSLEKIERVKSNNNLYDMFYPMFRDDINMELKQYKVRSEREMRMDLICTDIYGNTKFIDELMHINGIIDPYSVKKDDIILYPNIDVITAIKNKYEGNRKDVEIESNQKDKLDNSLTTSSPSDSYKQVMVDRDKAELVIINKLK